MQNGDDPRDGCFYPVLTLMIESYISQVVFVFICLASSYSLCAGIQLVSKGGTNPTLSELCPYNNYCHANASMVLNSPTEAPCCRPCSCNDDCWKRGECCPDKEPPSTRPPLEQCRNTIVIRRDLMDNGVTYGIPQYYVIDRCPDLETDEMTLMKCSGDSQETLDDFTWVTGTENGKIYKNKFCADCNGVRSFINWDLVSNCRDITDADSFKPGRIIPKGCRLFVNPPDSMKDVSANLCIFPSISQCNVTGAWEKYDDYIEEACAAFESPFLKNYLVSSVVYRNVFCYLCNRPKWDEKEDICEPLTTYYSSKLLWGEFIVLLNQKAIREMSDEKLEERCNLDEVYEPIQVVLYSLVYNYRWHMTKIRSHASTQHTTYALTSQFTCC